MHLKIDAALGTVHTRGRGLLQGWWRPERPELVLTRWKHQSRKLWMTPMMLCHNNFSLLCFLTWNTLPDISSVYYNTV
jgi:hypothetical protein